MTVSADDLQAIKDFAKGTTRSVLVTRRKDGGLQSSPMACTADDDGTILTATRAQNAKTKNLVRDGRITMCLFTDQWPGPWMHVEGEVEIERLPNAMPLLAAYYARRGQDTSTEEFRQRMLNENRVLIRVKPQRVVRPHA
ncbi:MAG: PPOX class F420-dependent oxidoreductase [Chloroflexi bacterium]|nr:PPOX class F420-dependent oxidoreductase [Chloroflexota bacterium]MBV9893337.1 PPOX class F420-dependent oxidoreductase [Chloroflexota bacterium]